MLQYLAILHRNLDCSIEDCSDEVWTVASLFAVPNSRLQNQNFTVLKTRLHYLNPLCRHLDYGIVSCKK